jgi:translation initiation factor RLI1
MKEVIWVMGPSAVGKETFIKTIAGDLKALKLLNMESESIVSCGAILSASDALLAAVSDIFVKLIY